MDAELVPLVLKYPHAATKFEFCAGGLLDFSQRRFKCGYHIGSKDLQQRVIELREKELQNLGKLSGN